MNLKITNELLFNYFAGRATAFEKQLIEEWTQQHEANREDFFGCLATWERQNPQFVADTDLALERHLLRMGDPPTAISDSQTTTTQRWWRSLMTAVAAILLLVNGWIFREQLMFRTFETEYGQTQQISLSDGSSVALNANSSLRVPRFGFGHQTREVLLRGEAEFNIKHTPDNQPFVVKTAKGFEVLVLGTVFTVYARPRGSKVVLSKGKIQLRYHDKTRKLLTMKPGDWVTLDAQGHTKLRQTAQPQIHASWKEHRFVFDETPFAELAYLFEENFGLKVQIADLELAQWAVSGSFTAHTAEDLLQTLTEAAGLTYHKDRGVIVIEQPH